MKITKEMRKAFVEMGRIGGKKASATMTDKQKLARAKKAAAARWGKAGRKVKP